MHGMQEILLVVYIHTQCVLLVAEVSSSCRVISKIMLLLITAHEEISTPHLLEEMLCILVLIPAHVVLCAVQHTYILPVCKYDLGEDTTSVHMYTTSSRRYHE